MAILDPLLIITMIQNKQKFKNGIRKIALAVAFLRAHIICIKQSQ